MLHAGTCLEKFSCVGEACCQYLVVLLAYSSKSYISSSEDSIISVRAVCIRVVAIDTPFATPRQSPWRCLQLETNGGSTVLL